MKEIRYDEIKAGDVIRFHGANELVTEVWNEGPSEYYPEEDVIRFKLQPADEKAVEMLGEFYSHGTYGGVGFLKVGLVQ